MNDTGLPPTSMSESGSPDYASDFRKQLAGLINSQSMEAESNTPDFILAQFLTDALEAFDKAVVRREEWYGRGDPIVLNSIPVPVETVFETVEYMAELDVYAQSLGLPRAIRASNGILLTKSQLRDYVAEAKDHLFLNGRLP